MVDDESTSILLPYFSFQLKNVDVEVAADQITKWIDEELQSQQDIKRNERLRFLLKQFKDDLSFCVTQNLKKYKKIQLVEKKFQERKLHKFMMYEANQIRVCKWLFDKSDLILRPLTDKLKRFKIKMENEKSETVNKTELAYKEAGHWKLGCLKKQNVKVLQYLQRDWKRKLEDSWKRIETQITSMHQQEINEKTKKAEKELSRVLCVKEVQLQPKLDLILNEKQLAYERKDHLQEKLEAARTKELVALDLLLKLRTSFEHFAMEIKRTSRVEAEHFVSDAISRHRKTNIDSSHDYAKEAVGIND